MLVKASPDVVNSRASGWGAGAAQTADARRLRRYPDMVSLMARAKRRVPRFAYDYLEGGVGDEKCIARNRRAFDEMEIVPRYGMEVDTLSTRRRLFGRDYDMPLGIAPMGLAGLVWPHADVLMAQAARKANIPFILSMVSNTSMEDVVREAPGSVWLQIYAVPRDDSRIVFDMIERAKRAGIEALVLTLDTPMRQKRLRDLRNGLTLPFRPDLRTVFEVATSPSWALHTLRHGQPKFANFLPYVEGRRSAARVATFVNDHMSGPTTWDLVKRVREKWNKPLVLKGAQHIDDAVHGASLGVDGIIVSNHGGRQFDAAPAPLGLLRDFRSRLDDRVAVMLDGAAYSGLDLLKAMVCGADFVFSGRPFLAATAALGRRGASHLAEIYLAELRGVMAQAGITDICRTDAVTYRMGRGDDFGTSPDASGVKEEKR